MKSSKHVKNFLVKSLIEAGLITATKSQAGGYKGDQRVCPSKGDIFYSKQLC